MALSLFSLMEVPGNAWACAILLVVGIVLVVKGGDVRSLQCGIEDQSFHLLLLYHSRLGDRDLSALSVVR